MCRPDQSVLIESVQLPKTMKKKYILFTIDVEDWYQVENLRRWFPVETWHKQTSRVELSTNKILDLLDSFPQRIKATFFVLGQVAEKMPRLINQIVSRGHEIASHGYNHKVCNTLNDKELFADLDHSKKLLEDISGKEIFGYRAPSFSISTRVLRLIQDCGYYYDSSYNNFEMHGRYGKIELNQYERKGIAIIIEKGFYELPISNLKIAGRIVPWGGGGYFRVLPYWLYKHGVKYNLNAAGTHLFYIHPWEIDDQQPRVSKSKSLAVLRHYVGLGKTYSRIEKMIGNFKYCRFISCNSYLKTVQLEKEASNYVHI